MAKKRKSDRQGLDEADRTLYSSFCAAANSVSQLYTQAQQQQRVAFQAGERSALEKLQSWLVKEQTGTSHISTQQLVDFVQRELDYNDSNAAAAPNQMPHTQLLPLPQHLESHQAHGVAQAAVTATQPDIQGKSSVFAGALTNQRRSMGGVGGLPHSHPDIQHHLEQGRPGTQPSHDSDSSMDTWTR
eukprot:jgi/Mesen1/693/ME000109S_10906